MVRLVFLSALTMVAFAANSVLNRAAVESGAIAPEVFAFVRVISGALALVLLSKGAGLGQRPSLWGVFGLSAYLIGFSQAYSALDAGLGALVLFGMVQVSMFAGALVQGDRVPLARWLGMAIAFGGLLLVLSSGVSGGGDTQVATVFMILAGMGWGLFSLIGQRVTDPLQATARSFVLSVPLVGLSTLGATYEVQPFGLMLAIVSGVVTSGLGYALWYSILPSLGASRAAVAQLTVPLIAMAGGMVFLREVLSWHFIASSAMVLSGIWLSMKKG